MVAVFVVAAWLVCGLAGAIIGEHKGRTARGFALGFLLGPLGVLAACTMPPSLEARVKEERASIQAREQAQFEIRAENAAIKRAGGTS